jgi:hypothetical protein
MTLLKFTSLLCASCAALLFGVFVIPDFALLKSPPPLVPTTLLAALFVVLAGVLLAVALSPAWNRLRHLRSHKVFHWIRPGALVPLLLLFLTFGIATPRAEAAGTNVYVPQLTRTGNCLSNIVTIGNTVSSNLPGSLTAVIRLTPGKPLALFPYYAGAQSTNTGLNSFQGDLSYDNGTSWTTTQPLKASSTGQGAQATRDYILFTPDVLNGATHFRLNVLTNSITSKITTTITNVAYSIPF